MSAHPAHALEVVANPARAAAALHPLRLTLLRELREPASAAALARKLELPRQKVNYHLRELERLKLVDHVEDRRKGNCIERVVQASARHYLIDPGAFGDLAADPAAIRDRFSWAYLVSIASKAVQDLATLRRRADSVKKKLPTFTLDTALRFDSPAALHAFTEELSNEFARLAAKHQSSENADEGSAASKARSFRFFLGAYPEVTKTDEEADAEARAAQHQDNENT